MGKFGDKLRRERELRAVTLDEIAEATKIGTRSLKALEDEQFDLLPGGIFNKGFVRAYSKYLGIDEEQAVADYTAAVGESTGKFATGIPDEALVQSIAKKREEKPIGVDNRSSSKVWVALAVVALVGFGGYSRWNYYKQRQAEKHAQQQASTAAQLPVATQHAATVPFESLPQSTTQAAEQSAPLATSTPSAQEKVAPAPRSLGPEFSITLHTKEEAWVSIQADGKTVIESLLTPDSDRTVTAKEKIVMKVGKPGAVEVSFNGTPIGPLGPPDKTVTKTFTADGVQ